MFESCPELVSNNQFISGQKSCDYGTSRSKENSQKYSIDISYHQKYLLKRFFHDEMIKNLPYFWNTISELASGVFVFQKYGKFSEEKVISYFEKKNYQFFYLQILSQFYQ